MAAWIIAGVPGLSAADPEGPIQLTVLGGTAQGTLALLSQGVGEMIRREYPGSNYTYEPGSMSGALMRVLQGQAPIAMTGSIELLAAQRREPPFERAPRVEVAVVARISSSIYGYFIARRDFVQRYGLRSVDDIQRLHVPVRISIGESGNLTVTRQSNAYLAAIGVTPVDIESWGGTVFRLPKAHSFDLMKDDRADVTFTGSYQPDASILELARTTPVQFLDPGTARVRQVAAEVGAEASVIPAGAYDFLASDLPATGVAVFLAAPAHTSDALVYKVAKALHRQFDYLRALHPAFAQLETSMLTDAGSIPLHPGAARYYREVGLPVK